MALLNQVQEDEIVLPAIQRDFVWSEDQTEKLLDSIMRGFPIGIVLLWETYEDLQYRSFVRDFEPGTVYRYRDNVQRRRVKIVLDGQQRLQSLFLALFGSREGEHLYFDLLSGQITDDVSEERFKFHFLDAETAQQWRDWSDDDAKLPAEQRNEAHRDWVMKVSELFAMTAIEKRNLVRDLRERLDLSDDEELRIDINLATFDEVLSKDPNILRVLTIDENLAADSPQRKSDADVLEIFVRVNREGTPLSRSDLIFSMLKLNWKESAEGLPEFIAQVNEGNSFGLDTDFVVRCLFAVSDLGSRLDLNVLRKKSNVEVLRANFGACCDAIRATVDFVRKECKVESSALLGGQNTLVPFVYYFFRLPRHEVPNSEIDNVRTALYAAAFARPFSRYADSRIGAFTRATLKPLFDRGEREFPIDALLSEIVRWERLSTLDELALRNESLALHLVQGLSGASVQYSHNSPEIDHIFPRAELKRKGYDAEKINHYANFWVLSRGKNRNKSDRRPKDYFADVSERQLSEALISREMLDYRRFNTFLDRRKAEMLKKLRVATGLSEDVFA